MAIALNRKGLASTRTALFRVDAGPGIGMGHFMRCRSLALEMLAHDWAIFFMGHGLPKEMLFCSSQRVSAGLNLIETPPYKNTEDDARDLLGKLVGTDCLIIDTYKYSREDFAFLQCHNSGRVPIVVIDDIASRDTPAQMVINPNPLFSPEPYQRQKIPEILCGADYTMIRPEVAALRGRQYCKEGPVVITLGGGDVVAPMMKILRALPANISTRICISVAENCPLQEIAAWVNECPDKRFINNDTSRFPQLLASASVAITGGGGTLWEVYCLGIPSLSLVWVANQKQTGIIIKEQATSFLIDLVENINVELQSNWLDSGLQSLISHFGRPCRTRIVQEESFLTNEVINREKTSLLADNNDMVDSGFVTQALAKLMDDDEFKVKMINRQRQLIDGNGVRRCVEVLNSLSWKEVPLLAADWREIHENRQI